MFFHENFVKKKKKKKMLSPKIMWHIQILLYINARAYIHPYLNIPNLVWVV